MREMRLWLFLLPLVVAASSAHSQNVEVEYDRFADTTKVTVSNGFQRVYGFGLQPDSIRVTLGVLYKGRKSPGAIRPYIALSLMRHTSARDPVKSIDSTDAIHFLIDGTTRFRAMPRTYASTAFPDVGMFSEIASYSLSAANLRLLTRARVIEARLGNSAELKDATRFALMAALVLEKTR